MWEYRRKQRTHAVPLRRTEIPQRCAPVLADITAYPCRYADRLSHSDVLFARLLRLPLGCMYTRESPPPRALSHLSTHLRLAIDVRQCIGNAQYPNTYGRGSTEPCGSHLKPPLGSEQNSTHSTLLSVQSSWISPKQPVGHYRYAPHSFRRPL